MGARGPRELARPDHGRAAGAAARWQGPSLRGRRAHARRRAVAGGDHARQRHTHPRQHHGHLPDGPRAARATAALPAGYVVDGRDLSPVLRDAAAPTAHRVLLLYCGFTPIAARVFGRWKLFWATQRWHTFDPPDYAICTQCCNGVVLAGKLFGVNATQMCQCDDSALEWHAAQPIVYDMERDPLETTPLGPSTWPASAAPATYAEVWRAANETRDAMVAKVHPKPRPGGGGTCGRPAGGAPAVLPRVPQALLGPLCVRDADGTSACVQRLRPRLVTATKPRDDGAERGVYVLRSVAAPTATLHQFSHFYHISLVAGLVNRSVTIEK